MFNKSVFFNRQLKFYFMKNLENFGVQELNTKEITKIDGGWYPFDGWTPIKNLANDLWNAFQAGFQEGAY